MLVLRGHFPDIVFVTTQAKNARVLLRTFAIWLFHLHCLTQTENRLNASLTLPLPLALALALGLGLALNLALVLALCTQLFDIFSSSYRSRARCI
jgi:hypothetical protein